MALSRHHHLHHRMSVRPGGRLARSSARARLPCNHCNMSLPPDCVYSSIRGPPFTWGANRRHPVSPARGATLSVGLDPWSPPLQASKQRSLVPTLE
ncbi:hypothetical protein M752DRAFT_62576 [Aspergillus phoenicis ATCC 13157]|uniref:Uncharacterized protein n=1 Tax=Aspergillus phoenicis ATCC 13157 TaxID=1353007 RepID=A0A370PWX2_ASPPH|nr:hypothetical protein M752DRAFT_62576 [Aspergillus phoenicis ATCC 13157]